MPGQGVAGVRRQTVAGISIGRFESRRRPAPALRWENAVPVVFGNYQQKRCIVVLCAILQKWQFQTLSQGGRNIMVLAMLIAVCGAYGNLGSCC